MVVRPSLIIIVRHGFYNESTGELDSTGIRQMQQCGRFLKGKIQRGTPVHLFTSPSPRAKQSAVILGEHLNVIAEAQIVLYSDYKKTDLAGAHALCQGRNSAVILVTHMEMCIDLPRYIGEEDKWDENRKPEKKMIGKGGIAVLDSVFQTCEYVSF